MGRFILTVLVLCLAGCVTTTKQYLEQNPDTPYRIRQAMLQDRIIVGMTKKQVLSTWGNPTSKNIITSRFGRDEHWHYNYEYLPNRQGFVMFRNGAVRVFSRNVSYK